jgi:hypothetical protein
MENFKAAGVIPEEFSWPQKNKFFRDATFFVLDDPFLFKIGGDGLLRICIFNEELRNILWHCHNSPYGGHFNRKRTTAKILQSGFYLPTIFKDAHFFEAMLSVPKNQENDEKR